MAPPVRIRVRSVRSHPEPLPLPVYKAGAVTGMELRADIDRDYTLSSMERLLVPTGVALSMPPSYEGQLRPSPGLLLRHGVTMLNSPSTVPASFEDEIHVLLINTAMVPFTLRRGAVIAHLAVVPLVACRTADPMRFRSGPGEPSDEEQQASAH